ncbi:HAMP domain-containing protein [Streptomyces sp. XD-27]|uniref:HAMP domain-containing protein n=1 Tax=Streptomyces sp. XD-27 TaxID=3062779 RepID=UPI0026F47840|nr:HAMP domain-containing protein [Streptomyces sp. XD-27]WKX73549.1 HAMP domain-containing protein [Streptomyces sp. XD-27]
MPLLGGVRPPIAALLCALLAVAVFPTLGLAAVHEQEVPQAVRDAERRIAEDAAASFGTSVDVRARAVRRSAASVEAPASGAPEATLRSLLAAGPRVRGGVLLDPRTGRPLAASGEKVPLTGVDVAALARSGAADIAPRPTTSESAGPRLLFFARVVVPAPARNQDHARDAARERRGGTRAFLLVVSDKVAALTVHGEGRTGQVVDRKGKVLATSAATGAALTPDTEDRALPSAAADAGQRTGDASGSMLGDGHDGLRRVAGWASVAAVDGKDDTSGLGLTILTFREVPPAKGGADHTGFAIVAAGALVVIAVLVTLVLWGIVQRPLLRLHLSAARLARGACGLPEARAELARPVPAGAFGEPGRVGRALESIRRQLLGETGPEPVPPPRRRPGVRSLVVVCALVIGAWGMPLLFLLNRVPDARAVPAAVVADQQARTEAAADRVRQSLGQSHADLTAMASAIAGAPRERATEVLRRGRADHPTYRSLYVLDRSGAIVLRVGKQPLRPLLHAPAGNGISPIGASGKIPAIAAYAQLKTGENDENDGNAKGTAPAVVVAEIGVDALNDLVARPGLGRVWLTDEHHKVVAASVDFEAFQSLPSRGLTRLVVKTDAAPGGAGSPASAVLHSGSAPGGGPSVAAAAPVAQTGPAAGLRWRVVSAEPAAALKLAAFEAQARTMLAGLLALSAGVACLGWLHIVVVRPLRTLANCAERLAAGDRRTVLYPVHHDECGSVARSLELLRQALAEQDRGAEAGVAAVPAPSFHPGGAP